MADFYADENFRYPVVEALRRLGHDVLTCEEAGFANQSIPDEEVLAEALASDRIVLTQNRRDFIKLDQKGSLIGESSSARRTPTPKAMRGGSMKPWLRRSQAGAGWFACTGRTWAVGLEKRRRSTLPWLAALRLEEPPCACSC